MTNPNIVTILSVAVALLSMLLCVFEYRYGKNLKNKLNDAEQQLKNLEEYSDKQKAIRITATSNSVKLLQEKEDLVRVNQSLSKQVQELQNTLAALRKHRANQRRRNRAAKKAQTSGIKSHG